MWRYGHGDLTQPRRGPWPDLSKPMMRYLTLALLCAPFFSCAPTSEDVGGEQPVNQPFVFSSFIEPTFSVTVVDENGAALPGVAVSVEDVYMSGLDDDSSRGHSVYLRGLTNSQGVFSGACRMPTVDSVDVVVHDDSGRTGPWTDTALRDQLEFYAPSSRQTVVVAAGTTSLNVVLVEVVE